MSRFLKLSSIIINISQIHRIKIEQNHKKYIIHLVPHYLDGLILFGFGAFNSSSISYTICEKEQKEDYQLVSKWLHYLEDTIH
jgi:hypothetical protein